ncbi:DUF58 domain-containing protein [Pseudalkalibacillus caeni]|uniref:DUF58 domain-containing protein n=1 Tax=Exobacillus caeni TaxID=2574798 RepID=A0A5R9EYZ3_9BACL|nr:DUF58 domain-containing protein [Pseudalkalibacillus caeni]TLS36407.1 DUF58 domain-containing protein [Pseudalkalibacillus caeni]
MEWMRTVTISQPLKIFLFNSPIIAIISIYFKTTLLFLIVFLLLLATYITHSYLKRAGNKLVLHNPKQTIRLYPGDKENMEIILNNKGRLPLFNSDMTLSLAEAVIPEGLREIGQTRLYTSYQFPIQIGGNDSRAYQIPITANKRGVTRVRNIGLSLQDLFGLGTANLTYAPFYFTELIVYPTPVEVKGIEELIQHGQGTHSYRHSLFDNLTSPAGAREYVSSDSFNRIHWKATARSQQLQTKVYEKAIDLRWTFVLNVGAQRGNAPVYMTEKIEDYLSQMAFMCEYAVKHNIPFEIYINTRAAGRIPFLHLELGEGKEQLSKALELLARVNDSSNLIKMTRMLNYLDRRFAASTPFILRFGDEEIREEEQVYYDRWVKKKRGNAFLIETTGHGPVVRKMGQKKVVSIGQRKVIS